MTQPSVDHELVTRALERWRASGRSRQSLARHAGIDPATFLRYTRNLQCVIRSDDARAALRAIAEPAGVADQASRLVQAIRDQAQAELGAMGDARKRAGALQLWEAIIPELLALRALIEGL